MGMLYAEQLEYMELDSMQERHESEIKILNEIDKMAILLERGEGTLEALEAKVEEYIAHVKEHFADEEKLMEEYDFPSYEMHKMAHDMFLVDLTYAIKQWKHYEDINKMINFVRKTPEWLVMHVNSVDRPTADYLAQKIKKS